MFFGCNNLKKLDEIKYLNTKYCYNFEGMLKIVHHYQILKDQKIRKYKL